MGRIQKSHLLVHRKGGYVLLKVSNKPKNLSIPKNNFFLFHWVKNSKNKSQAGAINQEESGKLGGGGQWQFLVSTENKLIQTLPGSEKAEEIKPKGFSNVVVD